MEGWTMTTKRKPVLVACVYCNGTGSYLTALHGPQECRVCDGTGKNPVRPEERPEANRK